MSQVIKEWMLLNCEAQSACADALKLLAPKTERDPFAQICGAFLHKAAETLSAVNVLYANKLQEPAQSLIRILFELRINFDCLLRLAHDDLRGAVQRVADGMMLEKIKQARASEYAGISAELRALLEKDETEIAKRYASDELNRIKKHGFTGVPIEQRANLTGHEAAYSIVYRNFSRNIHSTDYVESYIKAGIHSIENTEEYNQSRDVVAHYTAHFSAVGMLEFANHVFSLGMEKKIEYLGRRQAEIKAMP
jgi:hypothetical protein